MYTMTAMIGMLRRDAANGSDPRKFQCAIGMDSMDAKSKNVGNILSFECRIRLITQEKIEVMADDVWLKSLKTKTPQEGFELAITLSRRGVKYTQPDTEVLHKLRPEYANNADSLTLASQVIAIHFQTVAKANDYWT